MIERIAVILILLLNPALLAGARCAPTSAAENAAVAHGCCCGDSCPAVAAVPTACGCCATTDEPATPFQIPPRTELQNQQLAFLLALVTFDIQVHTAQIEATLPSATPRPCAVSRSILHCIWQT